MGLPACTPPDMRAKTPRTPTTSPSCCASSTWWRARRVPGVGGHAFAPPHLAAFPDGSEVWAEGTVERLYRAFTARHERIRVRPGLRRGRVGGRGRTDVRRDVGSGEGGRLASREGVSGARGPSGRASAELAAASTNTCNLPVRKGELCLQRNRTSLYDCWCATAARSSAFRPRVQCRTASPWANEAGRVQAQLDVSGLGLSDVSIDSTTSESRQRVSWSSGDWKCGSHSSP